MAQTAHKATPATPRTVIDCPRCLGVGEIEMGLDLNDVIISPIAGGKWAAHHKRHPFTAHGMNQVEAVLSLAQIIVIFEDSLTRVKRKRLY